MAPLTPSGEEGQMPQTEHPESGDGMEVSNYYNTEQQETHSADNSLP